MNGIKYVVALFALFMLMIPAFSQPDDGQTIGSEGQHFKSMMGDGGAKIVCLTVCKVMKDDGQHHMCPIMSMMGKHKSCGSHKSMMGGEKCSKDKSCGCQKENGEGGHHHHHSHSSDHSSSHHHHHHSSDESDSE